MDITQFAKVLSEKISPELATIIISALPVSELRGGLPVAFFAFKFSIYKAFFLSFVGNLIPVLPLLYFLESVSNFLSKKSRFFEKFFNWLFERTRKRFYRKYEIYGDIALILFVAIPLPTTGAWTGSLAAFLFGIKKLPAFLFITVGVLIAGIVVSLTSLGIRCF